MTAFISRYGPNRASQAACVLLHTMWKHTDLHGSYKKVGPCHYRYFNLYSSRLIFSTAVMSNMRMIRRTPDKQMDLFCFTKVGGQFK